MEQLEPRLREVLAPRVARLGYLGEFFKCAALQPDSLLAFMQFTEALKEALPDRVTELVALTVTAATGNEYERNQHERLCERMGYDCAWTAAVTRRGSGPSPLSPAELAIQRLTLSALDTNGRGLSRELTEVVEAMGSAQAMAILMLIGRYWAHSLIANALELAPPVPSIFTEDGS
jgi:alkylhydroperoxidase family enzyme